MTFVEGEVRHGEKLGRGRKEGETMDLRPELRAYIDHVLTHGYLAELEAARLRGEIADYPLFPGGKLVNGRIPLVRVKRYPERHLHVHDPDRWRDDFAKLEIKPHVRPKILKDNAVRALGLGSAKEMK